MPALPRQRWRIVLERDAVAPAVRNDAWDALFDASGLPAFRPAGRARPRVAFGASLPDGMAANRELADIVLTAREPAWRVRAALERGLPDGWRLIEAYDVWLGEPALAGQVVAADYRIELQAAMSDEGQATARLEAAAIERAAAAILAAESLPRDRSKGGSVVRYDLRPLLADIQLVDAGGPVVIRVRTRFDAERGVGRPDEVVAALGSAVGFDLVAGPMVRERLILAGESD